MSRVGFEPKIPASERAKTVHAFATVATVTGSPFFIGGWNQKANSNQNFNSEITNTSGQAVTKLNEALCYKSEGRGFDSR
jgi:hypothetical protein